MIYGPAGIRRSPTEPPQLSLNRLFRVVLAVIPYGRRLPPAGTVVPANVYEYIAPSSVNVQAARLAGDETVFVTVAISPFMTVTEPAWSVRETSALTASRPSTALPVRE